MSWVPDSLPSVATRQRPLLSDDRDVRQDNGSCWVVVAYCSLLVILLPLLKLRRRNLLKYVTLLILHPFVTNYHSRMNLVLNTHNALLLLATLAAKTRLLIRVPTTTLTTDAYHDIY